MYGQEAASSQGLNKAIADTPIRLALDRLESNLKETHALLSNLDGVFRPVLREPGPPQTTSVAEVRPAAESDVHARILEAATSAHQLSAYVQQLMERNTI